MQVDLITNARKAAMLFYENDECDVLNAYAQSNPSFGTKGDTAMLVNGELAGGVTFEFGEKTDDCGTINLLNIGLVQLLEPFQGQKLSHYLSNVIIDKCEKYFRESIHKEVLINCDVQSTAGVSFCKYIYEALKLQLSEHNVRFVSSPWGSSS